MTNEFEQLAEEAAEVGAPPPLPSVRRENVQTPRGRVSGLVWGNGPADVVLVHGAALNGRTWDATLLALGRPALAPDLPGHGDSDWWEEFDYTPDHLASAVASYADAVGFAGSRLVVGHSLGGMTAIALARSRPELVSSLILVDISPGIRREDAAALFAFMSGSLVFDSREQIVDAALAAGIGSSRTKLRRGVLYNTRVREDGKVVFKHHLASPPPGAGLVIDYSRHWEDLRRLEIPVTLLRATNGFLSEPVVEEFRERMPSAEILEVESGHNIQEHQPALLAALIRDRL